MVKKSRARNIARVLAVVFVGSTALTVVGACSSNTQAASHGDAGGTGVGTTGGDGGGSDGGVGSLSAGNPLVVLNNINMHTGPAVSATVITELMASSKVTVVDPTIQNTFLQVEYQGQTGWASAGYLADPSMPQCNLGPITLNATFTFTNAKCSITNSYQFNTNGGVPFVDESFCAGNPGVGMNIANIENGNDLGQASLLGCVFSFSFFTIVGATPTPPEPCGSQAQYIMNGNIATEGSVIVGNLAMNANGDVGPDPKCNVQSGDTASVTGTAQ